MTPEKLPQINLLPKYERQSTSSFLLFIVFIIIILLSYAVLGYYYFSSKSKLDSANGEVQQLTEHRDILKVKIAELESDGGTSLENAVTFVENHALPTSSFISELVTLLPEHSYLSEYQYGSQETRITIHFETFDSVASYTAKLTTSEFISDTKVNGINTFTLQNEELENETISQFEEIPRYEGDFTLLINRQKLKGESKESE